MTISDLMFEQSDCGQDAAAYVLGALEDEEAATFRQHMATCALCREEVAVLQLTADALPAAVPQLAAPRQIKRRVMSAVREDAKSARRTARRRRLLAPSRPALAVGAAVAAAAVAVGGFELASGGRAGSRLIQASVTAPSASAVLRLSDGHGELVLRRMPAPSSGHIYEVWLKRAGRQPSPTNTLFSVTSRGSAAVDVPGNLKGVAEILVTPEPLGGSLVPTHSPVIVAQLAST